MPDESLRDTLARLEARISDQDTRLLAQEAELARYRASHRTGRMPCWLRRVQSRLGSSALRIPGSKSRVMIARRRS